MVNGLLSVALGVDPLCADFVLLLEEELQTFVKEEVARIAENEDCLYALEVAHEDPAHDDCPDWNI